MVCEQLLSHCEYLRDACEWSTAVPWLEGTLWETSVSFFSSSSLLGQ